jgi:hypothetical protein
MEYRAALKIRMRIRNTDTEYGYGIRIRNIRSCAQNTEYGYGIQIRKRETHSHERHTTTATHTHNTLTRTHSPPAHREGKVGFSREKTKWSTLPIAAPITHTPDTHTILQYNIIIADHQAKRLNTHSRVTGQVPEFKIMLRHLYPIPDHSILSIIYI